MTGWLDDRMTATSLCMSQLATPWLFLCPPHWSLPSPTVPWGSTSRCGSTITSGSHVSSQKVSSTLVGKWNTIGNSWKLTLLSVTKPPRQNKKHQTSSANHQIRLSAPWQLLSTLVCLSCETQVIQGYTTPCWWFQSWNLQRYWTQGVIYDHRKYGCQAKISITRLNIFVWDEVKIFINYI